MEKIFLAEIIPSSKTGLSAQPVPSAVISAQNEHGAIEWVCFRIVGEWF